MEITLTYYDTGSEKTFLSLPKEIKFLTKGLSSYETYKMFSLNSR